MTREEIIGSYIQKEHSMTKTKYGKSGIINELIYAWQVTQVIPDIWW